MPPAEVGTRKPLELAAKQVYDKVISTVQRATIPGEPHRHRMGPSTWTGRAHPDRAQGAKVLIDPAPGYMATQGRFHLTQEDWLGCAQHRHHQ